MTDSIERFNGLLFEFINDLKRIEPNDKDILKVELLLHAINLKKEIVRSMEIKKSKKRIKVKFIKRQKKIGVKSI